MGLRAELNRVWPTPKFVRPANLKIIPIVKELEKLFPPAPTPVTPMTNLLEEVERILTKTQGNLAVLNRRQMMVIPFLLWTAPERWSENENFVTDYLAWADGNWRAAPRHLWTHYFLNMDPKSRATVILGAWLQHRLEKLSPTVRQFSQKWDLFRPDQAITTLAGSLLSNTEILSEFDLLKINRDRLLRSALILSVLESVGHQLSGYRQATTIILKIKTLLEPLGDTPLYKMTGSADLHKRALKSIVEGLVIWTENYNPTLTDQTLDLLHKLIGDPRLPQYQGRWQPISNYIRDIVEQWLTKITIDAFFRFMRELQVDREDMVQERETFWRGYQKYITRAWLITGRDGEALAVQLLDKSFGKFVTGRNVQRDHLGLMFRIGNYVIFEMNKIGGTLFWPAADHSLPGFALPEYNRSELMSACPSRPESGNPRFRLMHNPPGGWQAKYELHIRRITNISPATKKL